MHQLPQSACLRVNHRTALTFLCFMALCIFSTESSALALTKIEPTNDTASNSLNAPPPTTMEAQATTIVSMSGNLSAGEYVRTFNIDDPINTSAFSTGFQIFDSLGFGHDVTMYFTKTSAVNSTWQYNIMGVASEFTVVASSTSADGLSDLLATGTLDFTYMGLLDTEGTPTYHNSGDTGLTFTNGAAPTLSADLTFNFGTSITSDGGAGTDGMHQQGGASVLLTQTQNGYANGVLTASTINQESGQVIGRFSNGQIRILGQLSPTIFDIPKGKRERRQNRERRKKQNRRNATNPDTVQAKQSGVWTVGQLGTWHVKIDSDYTQPMAVMDMMAAKQSPWATMTGFTFDEGHNNAKTETLTIPENQRLVIEHISLLSDAEGLLKNWDDQKVTASIQVMLDNKPIIHHMGISETFVTRYQSGKKRIKQVISEPIRIYADPDSQIQLHIARSYFIHEQTGTISLSGYLEPVM